MTLALALAVALTLTLALNPNPNPSSGYYRDVLATPDGDDHPNIRNFMKSGWEGSG